MAPISTHPFELPDDVVQHLLRNCSVVSLVQLRYLDRLADNYVSDELQGRYRNLLRPFVSDHERFRVMLNTYGAVISGSGALAVCLHGSIVPHDLDVYLPKCAMAAVLAYLINVESYSIGTFLDVSMSEATYQGGIDRVICLRRGLSTIDVVISHTDCATLPLPHFWSTASMVYLTGDSICVPYPSLLEDRTSLLNPARIAIPGAVANLTPLIQKYRQFGFDFYLNEADWRRTVWSQWECPRSKSPTCPITVRWFGDNFCLLTNFATRAIQPKIAVSNLTTVWWRGGVPCGHRCNTGERGLVSGVWTQLNGHLG
ncbi:hypothetical protein C2E23DRAFT_716755 [Lenzites betulinus]|nr:hypothetical protein C2E23DRAFT_718040 [Lenzites betulinus]KAH9858957.1 hypothetical protein C2E23DRAFT_716755 [Lenzites betulinus]